MLDYLILLLALMIGFGCIFSYIGLVLWLLVVERDWVSCGVVIGAVAGGSVAGVFWVSLDRVGFFWYEGSLWLLLVPGIVIGIISGATFGVASTRWQAMLYQKFHKPRTAIDFLIERRVQGDIPTRLKFGGCSAMQILLVKHAQRVPLPSIYREYLRKMGVAMPTVHHGWYDYQYSSIRDLRRSALEIGMRHHTENTLPRDAFVIACNYTSIAWNYGRVGDEGKEYLYLRAAEGEDPPVHLYSPATGDSHVLERSFTLLLEKWLIHENLRVNHDEL